MSCKITIGLTAVLLLTACGSGKSMLTQDALNQAAQACGAQGARFVPSAVKDGAPDVHVVDAKVEKDGQQIDAPRCVAAKLTGYDYGRIVLDAALPAKTN